MCLIKCRPDGPSTSTLLRLFRAGLVRGGWKNDRMSELTELQVFRAAVEDKLEQAQEMCASISLTISSMKGGMENISGRIERADILICDIRREIEGLQDLVGDLRAQFAEL